MWGGCHHLSTRHRACVTLATETTGGGLARWGVRWALCFNLLPPEHTTHTAHSPAHAHLYVHTHPPTRTHVETCTHVHIHTHLCIDLLPLHTLIVYNSQIWGFRPVGLNKVESRVVLVYTRFSLHVG